MVKKNVVSLLFFFYRFVLIAVSVLISLTLGGVSPFSSYAHLSFRDNNPNLNSPCLLLAPSPNSEAPRYSHLGASKFADGTSREQQN